MNGMRPPEEVLKEPDLPPSPLLNQEACQVVVGVLEKYVHLGKGFRKRLFILQKGVLSYYKISEPGVEAALPGFLESLREFGEVKMIGNYLPLIESKALSKSSMSLSQMKLGLPNLTPQGEVHLQVATVRDSKSGDRKSFIIHSGTKKLSCRAESTLDKEAWTESLQVAKRTWTGSETGALFPTTSDNGLDNMIPTRGHGPTNSMLIRTFENTTLPAVKSHLTDGGVSEEHCKFVEEILVEQHRFYINFMKDEAEKRKILLKYIRRLEEEKRQLEQQLVLGGRRGTPSEVASENGGDNVPGDGIFVGDAESDPDLDNDEARDTDDGSDNVQADDGDIFFDCYPFDQDKVINEALSERIQRVDSHKSNASAGPGEASSHVADNEAQDKEGESPDANGITAQEPDEASTSDAQDESAENGKLAVDRYSSPEVDKAVENLEVWLRNDASPPVRRDRLPRPQQRERSVSLWSIIKSCVGKDLTRVCLPVYFNEPLSALQKTAEELEYSSLLDEAVKYPPGSVDRLARIATFAVSGYASTVGRTNKPFNPLLGETYEYVNQEQGFRFIGEKVVHHPTVFAMHCEGRGWVVDADGELRSKFWGAGIELRPVGAIQLRTADGEMYTWNKVITSVNGLILGKLYLDHYGIMKVRNVNTGQVAKLKFIEASRFFDRTSHQVKGHVEDANGQHAGVQLHGRWSESFFIDKGDGPVQIWQKSPPAPEPTRYNLTKFAIQMNELTEGLQEKLAPTDCRLRPDQRCLELGVYDEANNEKQRLEHKQRAARKAADSGAPIRPRWFEYDSSSKQGEALTFKYKGGYWESRDAGHFEGCRDIFGQ